MSERILRALMHLFAIIAKIDDVQEDDLDSASIQSTHGKTIIEDFLKTELSSEDVNKYINIFDKYLIETRGRIYSKKENQKRTSLQSVKILRICTQINKELTQRQKVIVLIRMLEFVARDGIKEGKELRFVKTVSDSFNIAEKEFSQIKSFIETSNTTPDEDGRIYYSPELIGGFKFAKSEQLAGLDSIIDIVQIKSVNTLFFKYRGLNELYINGQIVSTDKTHTLNVGSTLKTNKSDQLFYSDLISKINELESDVQLTYSVNNVIHTFKNGTTAVQKMNFSTNSGKLIGIMGGSGTGKTSLQNIMNGKIKPKYGEIIINGINLHDEPERLEGLIGNVSQSDLLIEELTVFENLYFSAKLCLKGLTSTQLTKKVVGLLKVLGLYEIRRLKVGSAIDKIISGGQRKRLNIALELIREPSILFIDEPTSGLSSRDSENIMDLLKELSLKGKLIFTIIHQPSSNIFKLFDRLFILDQGGFPVYDGIPLNAIEHFKKFSYKGNSHERECKLCGNVNPEQIFNLIEAKIIDEFGVETNIRKKSPADWNALYKKNKTVYSINKYNETPKGSIALPSRLSQFSTYLTRDFFSKIANNQYVLTNLMVAPFLALMLSFFIKYFNWKDGIEQYSYFGNENIPQFIFISVIVSIFIGLTIAAEEINKDKKNLDREKFINLSRSSYLSSKILILFCISAVQSLLFVLIGSWIMEIKGMWLNYWIILFSTACLSNIIGLNISSAFNSAKVIYIMVPLIIIPQLLFSGVIVKFDKLHPSLSETTTVPWIGNIMPTRWAYEAITVEQASQNKFEQHFLTEKINKKQAEWKKDYWIPEMLKQVNILKTTTSFNERQRAKEILINEISREEKKWKNLSCKHCIEYLDNDSYSSENGTTEIDSFINIVRLQSINTINLYTRKIEAKIDSIGLKDYKLLKLNYSNEALERLTTNKTEIDKIIVDQHRIYQNNDQIYNLPEQKSFLRTHLYSPYKYLFGKRYKTFSTNLIVLWSMSLLLYFILYFNLLYKFIRAFQQFFSIFNKRKMPLSK